MTWSANEALNQKVRALRFLLDESAGQFTRSLPWREQSNSGVPDGVWSLLLDDGLVQGNVPGGPKWRLTVSGWIEACRLLRAEVGLDKRFGTLSAHLKDLGGRTGAGATVRAIAEKTGLPWLWVSDAIDGKMAEKLYGEQGARLIDRTGGVEIPAHIGKI